MCVWSCSSFVCISAYANVYFKTTSMCPRSIAGVPFDSVRRFRASLRFVRKNKMLALGVCFPQPCSTDGRRFAASRSCLNYYEITFELLPRSRLNYYFFFVVLPHLALQLQQERTQVV